MRENAEATIHHRPEVGSAHARRPKPEPRYSVFRFLMGGTAAVVIAAAIWPMLPRHYVSQATFVIQPSGTNNAESLQVSATLRQPLDESAILSEIDTLRSDFLLDRLMQDHALVYDPEFSRLGRLTQLRLQLAGMISPDVQFDGGMAGIEPAAAGRAS